MSATREKKFTEKKAEDKNIKTFAKLCYTYVPWHASMPNYIPKPTFA